MPRPVLIEDDLGSVVSDFGGSGYGCGTGNAWTGDGELKIETLPIHYRHKNIDHTGNGFSAIERWQIPGAFLADCSKQWRALYV